MLPEVRAPRRPIAPREFVSANVTFQVDQSAASAGGDNVARDKINNTYNYMAAQAASGVIEKLSKRLGEEMQANSQFRERIESLQYFFEKVSHDGVDGLEAKLLAANRASECRRALRMKETFVMLMTKYSFFQSAQLILAHLLAFAEDEFKSHVEPQLAGLTTIAIDELISQRIIGPVVEQAGTSPLQVTRMVANGMVYWLAEQCYIRWHQ